MIRIILIILFSCSITFAQFDTYNLIVEYEQKCYADSSFQRIHKIPNDKAVCMIDWECIVQSHWSNKWIHREPTWDGFREFVKKKYQGLFEIKK